MSNPVMSNNPYFRKGAATPNQQFRGGNIATEPRQGYQAGPGVYEQPGGFGTEQPDWYNQQNFAHPDYGQAYQQQGYGQYAGGYGQPGAFGAPATATMTYDDAMVKTAILLAVSIVAGAATMLFVPLDYAMMLAIPASLIAFAVGMFGAWRPMVGPGISIAYSLFQGVALGAITNAFDTLYPGVAFQAILGTAIVVGVAVFLHMSGKVRTTAKGRRVVLTIMIAYIIFGFVNLILMLTGVTNSLRNITVGGFHLGIILGLVMIAVAGYVLISDLETAKLAVERHAPKEFAWTAAFGIVMTVLWIYLEVLRIVAYLAASSRN